MAESSLRLELIDKMRCNELCVVRRPQASTMTELLDVMCYVLQTYLEGGGGGKNHFNPPEEDRYQSIMRFLQANLHRSRTADAFLGQIAVEKGIDAVIINEHYGRIARCNKVIGLYKQS